MYPDPLFGREWNGGTYEQQKYSHDAGSPGEGQAI